MSQPHYMSNLIFILHVLNFPREANVFCTTVSFFSVLDFVSLLYCNLTIYFRFFFKWLKQNKLGCLYCRTKNKEVKKMISWGIWLWSARQQVLYTGWVKKKWDLKKYVYCSEGHKNQVNQILILCMFFSTLGHMVSWYYNWF